eukprot:2226044-Rhodomonas_salina.1
MRRRATCVRGMAWWMLNPPTDTSSGTMIPPPPIPPAAPSAEARNDRTPTRTSLPSRGKSDFSMIFGSTSMEE